MLIPEDIQVDLWRAIVTAAIAIIGLAVYYIKARIEMLVEDMKDAQKERIIQSLDRQELMEICRDLKLREGEKNGDVS
jgi:hypothetical protein